MTVNTSWTEPTSATLDLAAGAVVGETNWDAAMSNLNRLGGSDGNTKTGPYTIPDVLTVSNPSSTAEVKVKATTAGQQAQIQFLDGANIKWRIRKYADNTFDILDEVNSRVVARFTAGGVVQLDGAQGTYVGASPGSPGANNLQVQGSLYVGGNAAPFPLSTASAALGTDVTLTTTGTYYDGPSVSLAAGTWLLVGHVTLIHSGSGINWAAKLWDGTTVVDSASEGTDVANRATSIALAGIVSPGSTTTYKISATDTTTGTNGLIKAAMPYGAAGNTASTLRAVRIG